MVYIHARFNAKCIHNLKNPVHYVRISTCKIKIFIFLNTYNYTSIHPNLYYIYIYLYLYIQKDN